MNLHYQNIFSVHGFRDYHCHRLDSSQGCGYEMREFEIENSDLPPKFNILKDAEFFTNRPYDCYNLYPVINANRALLVSEKLYHHLVQFKLPRFVEFPGVKVVVAEKILNYIYLYFHEDFSKNIVLEKSKFKILDRQYLVEINKKNGDTSLYTHASNLLIKNMEEFSAYSKYYYLQNKQMFLPDKLFIKDCSKYDILPFLSEFCMGLLISPKLVSSLKKSRITGISYWNNIYFDLVDSN